MAYTREKVRYMMRRWGLFQTSLARYERERVALMGKSPGSVIFDGGRSKTPANPTLNTVERLERLDAKYGDILKFTQCVNDVVRYLQKPTARLWKAFYYKGLPMHEAAKKAGMSYTTCWRRINDALDTLVIFLNKTM